MAYKGIKTAAANKPGKTSGTTMPGPRSGYRGIKPASLGADASNQHVGMPRASHFKEYGQGDAHKPAAGKPLDTGGGSRHRMAGSHDGMYVTEHHRTRKG